MIYSPFTHSQILIRFHDGVIPALEAVERTLGRKNAYGSNYLLNDTERAHHEEVQKLLQERLK